MEPMGGSEISYYKLKEKINPKYFEKINLILSICDYESIDDAKINVLWQQLSYDQENVQLLKEQKFIDKIDCFVFVSHWQYEKFRKIFGIPAYKSVVIQNATEKSNYKVRDNEKIKLIYTSTPWRGLEILLNSFEKLSNDNVELDIYSSTKIYGSQFEKLMEGKFDELFDRAKSMKNVNYHGYADNAEIKTALTKSNIFAYPCVFEETSCISAIEALTAGCKIVTTSIGALPETCGLWADYVTFGPNLELLSNRFTFVLNRAINNYQNDLSTLKKQNEFYNEFYSWETRIKEWEKLFDYLTT